MLIVSYSILLIFIFILEKLTGKKIKNLLPFLFVVYLILLMGGSQNVPDSDIYNILYYKYTTLYTKDIGFGYLIYYAKFLGFSYSFFKLGISIIGLFLITYTIKKFTKSTLFVYIMYFTFPFLYDVCQVRNFLAFSIVIFAISILLEDRQKWNKLIFIFLVFFAALFHKAMLLYLPFVFFDSKNMKRIIKYLIVLCCIFLYFITIDRNMLLSMLIDFNNIVNINGLENHLSYNTTYLLSFVQLLVQIGNFFLIYIGKKIYSKYVNIDEIQITNKNRYFNYIDFTYMINIYMFLFVPLYFFDISYNRIMRNIFILNYIVYGIILDLFKTNNQNNCKKECKNYLILCVIYNLGLLIFYFFIVGTNFDKLIIYPLFTDNWINDLF